MHVLLTHGYFLCEDPKERLIMKPYPPLGILYLSAWLDRFGVDNAVFDTTFSTPSHLYDALLDQKPRILALYVNLMTKLRILEIAQWVKSRPELSHTLIVMGGPDVTHNIDEYLRHGADIVVVGEGEQTMLEIALAGSREDWSSIPGTAFRLSDGSVFRTAVREKIRDIDELPFPNRHKIDLQAYLDAWKQAHGQNAVSISTQRGCPYTCKWCSTAVYGQSYRRRSPAKVVDEIEQLRENYEFDLIWFVDDVFTVSHKWLYAFRDELRRRSLRISFECITRADRLNEEIVLLLKECGCFRVWIGAESGSQRVVDAMDRRVEVGQVRAMIRAASVAGIQSGTFIMLGYPGETEADIFETLEHLKVANPDLFTITVAYPIKGTALYEEVRASSFSEKPWAGRSDREVDFERVYPRPYYDYAVRWMVNSVRLHKYALSGERYGLRAFPLRFKAAAARAGMIWWKKR